MINAAFVMMSLFAAIRAISTMFTALQYGMMWKCRFVSLPSKIVMGSTFAVPTCTLALYALGN